MSQTTNIGLTLTGESETEMLFLEWRTLINGIGCDSNMEKLDNAIGQINQSLGNKADGLVLDKDTGILTLTCSGEPIPGAEAKIDLNAYYTKDEVDALLESISASDIDLSDYYTKEETDAKISEISGNSTTTEAVSEIRSNAVSRLEWDEANRQLTAYNLDGSEINEPIVISGGGGGGSSYTVRLVNNMSATTYSVAYGTQQSIDATYYEYYGTDLTGSSGILSVSYKLPSSDEWVQLADRTVQQGVSFSVDIGEMLLLNQVVSIKLTVTGGESEQSRSLTYNITAVEATISAVNYDATAVYSGNINFQYKCMGRNLKKVVHFLIDDEEYAQVDVGTSHNTTLSQQIELLGKYEYGAHTLVVYFDTPDGAKSNELRLALLYDDGSASSVMISAIPVSDDITYGDALEINYMLYTPNQETTDSLSIRIYQDIDGTITEYLTNSLRDLPNCTQFLYQASTYPESGKVTIEFKSGTSTKLVHILVHEIQTEYDLHSVETGLVYSYSAAGKSNNDSNKDLYTYSYTTSTGTTTSIKGVFEGFNWVSNGYVDSSALTLSGAAKHVIKLPIFSTSYVDDDGQTISLESSSSAGVTTNGRTFEIEFKVDNVTDSQAPIIRCMSDDHAGFLVTPQNCYLLASNGANVILDETGFIENEESIAAAYIKDGSRIRLSFVIEPKASVRYEVDGQQFTGQCVNIYINGQFANSFPYPDNARFTQSEYITIGDSSCITNIYDIHIYNRGLTAAEIIQNYKASPISVQERISRFEDNDVLTDDGDIDYYKAIEKYPCLLITGSLSPYKGANGTKTEGKIESGLTLTKPDGNGGHTVEFNLLDKDSDGVWVSANNVQGTSSVKFPVKNYKIYLAKLETDEFGQQVKKKVTYSLKGKDPNTGADLSIGESTLCWKGDYMSSDHANTFNANLADTLFNDVLDSQNPAKGGDSRVQNTVYGFRCLLFRRDDVGSTIEFAGDGALNNDKGNSKTFGLECNGDSGNSTTRQKWEFKNNTEALCSFQTDRFYELIDGKKRVLSGLESLYPDQGDLEDVGLEPNYDHLQVLFTWVFQRANFWDASTDEFDTPKTYKGIEYKTEREYRKAIFNNEFDKHFNRNHAIVYYLFSEFIGLSDNRAKNMHIRCEDVTVEQLLSISGEVISINDVIDMTTGEVDADMIDWENSTFAIWITDLYDLDSAFMVENSGYMQIPYYADWNYQLNGTQKFNGRESRLWLMVEEALADSIQKKAQELTDRSSGNGALNYEALYDYHIKNNALLVCPAVINRDMEHKYSDPWTDGYVDYSSEGYPVRHISDYKYLQRGSRTEQKDSFIFRRSNMLYSKYKCSKFINNNINFRVGANGGVPASDSGITVTASQVLFPAVKYGDGDAAIVSIGKTNAGTPATIIKPGTDASDKVGFSDTVYIAGGTMLTDIGDISKFRPYELQLQNATGLRRLTIGSDADGYSNTSLKGIDTSPCKILEELDIRNCSSLTGNINLSSNGILRVLHAGGCGASSITLPNGGVLEEIELGKVSDLEILNHPNLATFSCDSYDNIKYLRVENSPNVPVVDIVLERFPYLVNGLRLVGIDVTAEDSDTLFSLLLSDAAKGKYVDNNGVLSNDASAYPYISGTIHCDKVGSYTLQKLNEIYPNLTIDYTTVVPQHLVVFKNCGEEYDVQYVMNGQSALNPLTRKDNPMPMPTKPSTPSTAYTFEKWSGSWRNNDETTAITSNTTFEAQYIETVRKYTVTWIYYDGTGTQVSKSIEAEYGSCVTFDGDTPVRVIQDSTEMGHYWLFDRWDKSTSCITEDTVVNAVFSEAYLPDICEDKPKLETMSPVDLYALIQGGKLEMTRNGSSFVNNNEYIQSSDSIAIMLGRDFEYENIRSRELVASESPRTFNGTTADCYIPQDESGDDIMLFKDDASFVLAVDFEFDKEASENSVLMSCFSSNNGFKLQSGKVDNSSVLNGFIYGGQEKSAVSSISISNVRMGNTGTTIPDREIVVIRKVSGDNNLYIYSSNKMSESISEAILSGAFLSAAGDGAASYKNAPLAFGAHATATSVSLACKGIIYWSKLWYGDIGEDACRELASWPHEQLTFAASGKDSDDLYNLYVDSTADIAASHCCFISKGLLGAVHTFSTSGEDVSGWANSDIRTWIANRVYKALPSQWQMLIAKAKLMSVCTDGSSVETNDYVWMPSSGDLGDSGQSDVAFAIFSDNASRVKISPITCEPAGYYTRTCVPGTSSYHYVRGVEVSGQIQGNFTISSSLYRSVCVGFFI